MSENNKVKPWYIYLLLSDTRTYIGATVDPRRRLRQHNGEIKGGARSTRGRVWSIVCVVGMFENKSCALRWERIVKSRSRGLKARLHAMKELAKGVCPPGRKHYDVPSNLTCQEYDNNV